MPNPSKRPFNVTDWSCTLEAFLVVIASVLGAGVGDGVGVGLGEEVGVTVGDGEDTNVGVGVGVGEDSSSQRHAPLTIMVPMSNIIRKSFKILITSILCSNYLRIALVFKCCSIF